MFNVNSKLSIIMDEIDGCLSGDKGGVKQIIKMIFLRRKLKKKKTNKTKNKLIKQNKANKAN